MSISILTYGKTIQNNGAKPSGIDISTRNLELSTYVGYLAGEKNTGFYNTFIGRAAGQENDNGASNVFLGNDTGNQNTTGSANTFLGTGAGGANLMGEDNIFIGLAAGAYNVSGARNVFLGNYAGAYLNGYNNILIGYNNTYSNAYPSSSNNIGIGTGAKVFGFNNTSIGNSNIVTGTGSIIYGTNIRDSGQSNTLFGTNITNTGKNNIIIWTKSNNFVNSSNNIINFNDAFVFGDASSNGTYGSFKLAIDNLFFGSSNTNLTMTPSNYTIVASNLFQLNGSNQLVLDNIINQIAFTKEALTLMSRSNISLQSSNVINIGNAFSNSFTISNDIIIINNASNNRISLDSNQLHLVASDLLNLTSSNIVLLESLSNITVMSSNVFEGYADDVLFTACNDIYLGAVNTVAIASSNATRLVNNSNLFKQDNKGTSLSSSNLISVSNPCNKIEFDDSSILLDAHCGSITNTFVDNYTIKSSEHVIELAKNADISVYSVNDIILASASNSFITLSNNGTIDASSENIDLHAMLTSVYGDLSVRGDIVSEGRVVFNGDVLVGGKLGVNQLASFSNGINVTDGFKIFDPATSNVWWREFIEMNEPRNAADLIFQSANGTRMTFCDEFQPDVLNFTGKHRCVIQTRKANNNKKDFIGKIVISTGRYCNLKNTAKLDMDEAIPIVKLSEKANDKRVFGVIGGFDEHGKFHIGNIQFHQPSGRNRAVVHSVGEGCIYVCDINGPLENGDYITTSVIPGFGMRQNSPFLMNTTVAKVTCDCGFDEKSKVYECRRIKWKGTFVKVALVGCTYH